MTKAFALWMAIVGTIWTLLHLYIGRHLTVGLAGAPRVLVWAAVFAVAAARLASHYHYHLDQRPALLRRGFLVLSPEWPAPRNAKE